MTEGSDVGSIQKVCVNPDCPVHHPKKATSAGTNDARWKAEQEKRRKEEAIGNATRLRVLAAIGAAVPARLTKRELLFIADRLRHGRKHKEGWEETMRSPDFRLRTEVDVSYAAALLAFPLDFDVGLLDTGFILTPLPLLCLPSRIG
jgi:hypothetical protein